MEQYKKYLADKILTDGEVVTYRLISRELKVHVNTAKQMLYEFHSSQNKKKPGSVYATYLIYGVNDSTSSQPQLGADGDVEMSSSFPDVDSVAEVVPVYTMSLVQEDRLKDVLAGYDDVDSIHVYSVGPHPTKDLTLLSEVARNVLILQTADDSTSARKTYGGIANPHVRRREREGQASRAATVPIKQEPKATSKPATKPAPVAETAKEPASRTTSARESPTSSGSAPAKKPIPTLKKNNSGIMQAFSKAASQPKKIKEPEPVDTPMSDDGEDDDQAPQAPTRGVTAGRKTRKEREDELKRMMDEEEEEDDEDAEEEEEEKEEMIEEPEEEQPAPESMQEEPKEVVSTSGDGRRRGKRRVMKKKQIMDDQGYLVTIQEEGWESFSEDEGPPPVAIIAKPAAAPAPVASAKGKKAASKAGQGNIMSFFSKK